MNTKQIECLVASVPVVLKRWEKGSTFGHPVWSCPFGEICIRRPEGLGGVVTPSFADSEKKWGNHEKIHGIVRCRRFGGKK
jgi:hypothetical protein